MRRLVIACACLAAGCGGEEEPADKGRTVTVPVDRGVRIVGRDYSFDPATVVTTGGGGDLRITLDNRGSLAHNVKVFQGERDLGGSPTFAGGDTRTGSARVAPGRYELICTVGDHAELGMRGVLEVRE